VEIIGIHRVERATGILFPTATRETIGGSRQRMEPERSGSFAHARITAAHARAIPRRRAMAAADTLLRSGAYPRLDSVAAA
jgi:hypothetical protein